MTIIVTTMPGSIVQIFNPQTGRITYKCKGGTSFMKIDAFGGVVRFNCKNSKAIVSGHITELKDCAVIPPGDPQYEKALEAATDAATRFKKAEIASLQDELESLKDSL